MGKQENSVIFQSIRLMQKQANNNNKLTIIFLNKSVIYPLY